MMNTIFLVSLCTLQLGLLIADDNEIECGPFPDVINASPVQVDTPFTVGAVVNYACNFGYLSVNKGDSSVCKINDNTKSLEWTIPSIHCRPRSCGDPGSLTNGQRVGSLFTFPNSVEYICNEGYRLIGLARLYCSGSGTWTGRLPKCKIIDCPAPSNINYGQTSFSSTTYGSEASFKCDKGYVLDGVNRITCTEFGEWSDAIPSCQEISCDVPEPPTGASTSVSSGKVIAGSSIVFSCDPGLVLKGSSVLKCMHNGQWNFDLPICSRPCTSMEVANGNLGTLTLMARAKKFFKKFTIQAAKDALYPDESELILRCNKNYEPLGLRKSEATVRCVNGEWKPQPVCQPASCRSPEKIPDGGVSFKSMKHGAVATYHCNHGYYLAAGGVKKCQLGYWIGPYPLCISGKCNSDPPPIEHGNALWSNPQKHGEYMNYRCDKGYTLSENSSVLCYQGQWQGKPPSCYPENCKNKPPPIQNGKAEYTSNNHGSVAEYICDRGYKLVSFVENYAIVCNRGVWDGMLPSCVIQGYNCLSKPPEIENGKADLKSQSHGAVVTYSCDEGYILDQNATVVCNFSRWYGTPPKCIKDYNCRKPPPEVDNGKATYESENHGSISTYTCNDGYILFQASPVICKYGEWNGTTPFCFPDYNCRNDPPSIKNGKASYQNLKHGSIATYSCDDGYSLNLNTSLMCYNKNWTGTVPFCIANGFPLVHRPLSANFTTLPNTLKSEDNLSDLISTTPLSEDFLDENREEPLNNSFAEDLHKETIIERNETKHNINHSITEKPLMKKNCVFHIEDRHLQIHDGEHWIDEDNVIPHGKVLQFHCKDFTFYKLIGPSKIKCNDGIWQPEKIPFCLLLSSNDFFIVPRPIDSILIGPGGVLHVKPGKFIEIECLAFYNPRMPRPYWTTDSRLHPVLILLPERPTSAILRIESTTSGYSGTYTCNSDNMNIPSQRITLKVLDVVCPEIPAEVPLRVKYEPDRKQYGMAHFSCDYPWILSDRTSLQCLPDGSWTKESPSCLWKTCSLADLAEQLPELVVPDLSEDATENVTAGSQIPLQCYIPNLVLKGEKYAKCLQSGHWEALNVTCIQGCVPYWQFDNSSVVVSSTKEFFRFGEQVTFSCSDNKTLSTNIERIICLGNGWSDNPLPECKDN